MRSDKLCPLPYNMTAERVSEAITLYYTVGKQREQAHTMENPLVLNFDTLRGTLQSLLLFIFIKKNLISGSFNPSSSKLLLLIWCHL
jgi:hypothetical protein